MVGQNILKVNAVGSLTVKKNTATNVNNLMKTNQKGSIDIALDENKARELTKDIIFKDTGKAELNWYNCVKKHNIQQKVAIIKQLAE